MTEAELQRLLDVARRRPLTDAMTVRRGRNKGEAIARLTEATKKKLDILGRERALIYKTLVLTGLRKSELASLTIGQLELDGPVAYAVLHLLVFAGLDYNFALDLIIEDLFGQLRTVVGAAAWISLLPLAVTSTNGWMKRLGRRWKRLHRLTYLSGVLAVLHYLWAVKDGRDPYLYGGLLLVLFILRIPALRKMIKRFWQGRR